MPALPPRRQTAPLTLERRQAGIIVGIDEVGRAPYAGPVMAAAVALPRWKRPPKALSGLTDSKRLSKPEREAYCTRIRSLAQVGLGAASVTEIARLNIHNATLLAMRRAYRQLGLKADLALVDGKFAPDIDCRVETVIRGDSKSLSIAAASVVAKVARDRLMETLDRRHPGYGWDCNAGYGTEVHYFGLLRLGASPHHRLSFDVVGDITGDLFTRDLRFAPLDAAVPGASLVRLRKDFAAVFDGGRAHIGFLKAEGDAWRFFAMGYDASGSPLPDGGPCAHCHGSHIAAPMPSLLDEVLFAENASADASPLVKAL